MDTHEVYNPATDSWSTAASLPTAVMDNYTTVAFGNRIYVFGGSSGGFNVLNLVQICDSLTNTWSTGTLMPTARSNAVAGVLCNRIVVAGGINNTGTNLDVTEIYDPATDSWIAGPSKPRAASEVGTAASFGFNNMLFAVGSGVEGLTAPSMTRSRCMPLTSAPATSPRGLVVAAIGVLLIGVLYLRRTRRLA